MTERSQREIKALIAWLRKAGAIEIKLEGLEAKFAGAQPINFELRQEGEIKDTSPEQIELMRKKEREALLYGSS